MGKFDEDPPKMVDCPFRDAHGTMTPYGKAIKYRQCPNHSDDWRVREYILDTGEKIREVRYSLLNLTKSYNVHRQKTGCVWFDSEDLELVAIFPYMFSKEEVDQAIEWMKENGYG